MRQEHACATRYTGKASVGGASDAAMRGHTYVIDIVAIDTRITEDKHVRITPFNPLCAVRRRGQSSRGDALIAEMFVSLASLMKDCDDMPSWWHSSIAASYRTITY